LWTTKGGYCFFARILGAAFWSHTQCKIHCYLFLEIGSISRWPCNQFPKDRWISFLWNIKYIDTYFWKLEAYPDGHATNSPKIGGFLFCEIFPSFSFPQKWISMTWISSSIASQIFIRMILRRLPVRVEEYQILESFKKTGKFCTVTKFCGTTGSLVKMVYINWRSVNY